MPLINFYLYFLRACNIIVYIACNMNNILLMEKKSRPLNIYFSLLIHNKKLVMRRKLF